MGKFCPDCGWPYLEDTDYMRHLIKKDCELYQKDDFLVKTKLRAMGLLKEKRSVKTRNKKSFLREDF